MRKNMQNSIIAAMLAVSSIITISSGKLKINLIPCKEEAEVIEIKTKYDNDTVCNFVVVETYNNYTEEKQLFIANKIYTNYSRGRGYNYLNIFSDNILSDNEFTFLNEEPLISYLLDYSEFKPNYTYDDLCTIYDRIIGDWLSKKCKSLKYQESIS